MTFVISVCFRGENSSLLNIQVPNYLEKCYNCAFVLDITSLFLISIELTFKLSFTTPLRVMGGFGLYPSSCILKTRKDSVSEAGCVSLLRRVRDTCSVGSLVQLFLRDTREYAVSH
jgi:hypothetical protein